MVDREPRGESTVFTSKNTLDSPIFYCEVIHQFAIASNNIAHGCD
jgi:hypothetical protein